ncbi:arf-GAP with coiled-coil, ANK repeat and PH domain-containing protein 2-like [Rhincodon typus]|uniref:arf-GAP with coiled-coil, ANK repeat and PH domain-containing protein 2-like n=1 Tax=Rhincodon typus TaxID=259920 RepID=UPI00202F4DEF|nr:arf-GAP with coiled-coil, ANK repeat and PH domain-containing protein 2-like [Rhincodon typus]
METLLLRRDIWRLRDLRKNFERISEDLETAVLKNGQVCRQRVQESQECSHLLVATRKCFRHLALDYVLQMNAFEIQQKFKILNTVLAYLKSEHTFFHQGYDLVSDLDPLTKVICSQVIMSPALLE